MRTRSRFAGVAAAAAVLCSVTMTTAFAQPVPPPVPHSGGPMSGCVAKRAEVQRELDAARVDGPARRVRGLESALREVNANCSDARLQDEQQARIQRQEKKVAERRRDLDKARSEGKPAKISTREAKLAEEEQMLQRLRAGAR